MDHEEGVGSMEENEGPPLDAEGTDLAKELLEPFCCWVRGFRRVLR